MARTKNCKPGSRRRAVAGGKSSATKTPSKPPAKRHRRAWVVGTRSIREIRRYQHTVDLLIPKSSFQRVVRDVLLDVAGPTGPNRMQASAINAMQEFVESQITSIFELSNLACIHGKRVTLQAKDMDLVKRVLVGSQSIAVGYISIQGHHLPHMALRSYLNPPELAPKDQKAKPKALGPAPENREPVPQDQQAPMEQQDNSRRIDNGEPEQMAMEQGEGVGATGS